MKVSLPRTIRITERKLGKEKAMGLCWHGKIPHMEIDPNQTSQQRLDTVLHELTHCILQDADEETVTKIAQRMASVLWSDGWRRIYS